MYLHAVVKTVDLSKKGTKKYPELTLLDVVKDPVLRATTQKYFIYMLM